MAKKKDQSDDHYIYLPMEEKDLCINKEYWTNCEGRSKNYTKQVVRSRVTIDRKAGIHKEESPAEYLEYRTDLVRWCRNGWILKRITAPTDDDFIADISISTSKQIVVLGIDNDALDSVMNDMSKPQSKLFG